MTPDFALALRARADAFHVTFSDSEIQLLSEYYKLLMLWNRRINLTALPLDNFPEVTLDRLLIEPKVAVGFLSPTTIETMDLGSGGGSPAIPLKIARSELCLTMVESRERKAAFLRDVVRQLALVKTTVLCSRFEKLQISSNLADLISVRAVRLETDLTDRIHRWLKPGGLLLLFGARGRDAQSAYLEQVDERALPGQSVLQVFRRLERSADA